MHLNYHFFRFLCPVLRNRIKETKLSSCFSQNKDELVLVFSDPGGDFFVVAHLLPASPCIYFPEDFKRSKRNNVTLFSELIGEVAESIHLFAFERAFAIKFSSGKRLLFKMHGNRSNLLLYMPGENLPKSVFRKSIVEDMALEVSTLENALDLSRQRFAELEGNASHFLPTLGKIPRAWLKERGYIEKNLDQRFELIEEVLGMLDSPLFSILKVEDQYVLTLLPCREAVYQTSDPLDACNAFFRFAVIRQNFEREKARLIKDLEEKIKKTNSYIKKSYEKLEMLEKETSPRQIADIIMANLHEIPHGVEVVELFDFYHNEIVPIKLKRDQTPQKLAENLYRKAKNRQREILQLEKNLSEKENLLSLLNADMEEVSGVLSFKELKAFSRERGLISKPKDELQTVPFKRFESEGFDILIGKSSKANDEMLRRYAWKEDMWLHAKNVSGSHVLIKHRAGATFPKTVLERAAELAAYYSKYRGESLCPVIYTPAKFVRKVKGAAPGAVMVDRENVILVRPSGPNHSD